MLNKSQMGVKSIIFVLSAGAVFIGFMFSGAFDSLQAYCTYIVSGYYGDDCREDEYPSVKQITDNEVHDIDPNSNDLGHIVWTRKNSDIDYEIVLYDGSQVTPISSNADEYSAPVIANNGSVFWPTAMGEIYLWDGQAESVIGSYSEVRSLVINDDGHAAWVAFDLGWDVYFFNGSDVINITNGSYQVYDIDMNGLDQIVWTGTGDEIFLYDSGAISPIITTDANFPNKRLPQISDAGHIVWFGLDFSYGNGKMFLYDGNNVSVILENASQNTGDYHINSTGQVVWRTYEGGDSEIYFYNGDMVIQITDNELYSVYPQLNNDGYITWMSIENWGAQSLDEIYLYDGQRTFQITNNFSEDTSPAINNGGTIVWQGYHDSDYEIYLSQAGYNPDEYNQAILEERSMWDADGDGKIGLAEAIQALKTAVGGQ